MKQLLVYIKDYRKECILGPLFKLLEASFELLLPLVVAAMIDIGIPAGDKGYIVQMCLIMAALGLIGFLCSVTAQFFAAKAAVGFSAKLRQALFSHIQGLSFSEMDTIGTATLITRMTSDINQLQTGVNLVLRLFLRSPFIVFGAMIMAFTINIKAAMIFVVVIPLLSLIVFGIMVLTMPLFKRIQQALDHVLRLTRENLTGVRVIRAFHEEEHETAKFDESAGALQSIQLYTGKISALMNPLTYIVINGGIVALIYSGALQVAVGDLTQGAVIALVNYMSQILVELIKLANLIITITKSAASGNRVKQILDTSSTMESGTITAGSNTEYVVEFDHVSMHYRNAGDESLYDIHFQVKKGETIGIIGSTGAGKSSLVHLIPRFYDVSRGSVRVNGLDVREYSLEKLRLKIGIVMQKPVLFKGTIRENLLWGNERAGESELAEALRAAQAEEFVMSRKKQLDSEVEQEGRNLSGGQKQRLSIARAIVKKPEILILDDSSSALDYATDLKLRNAIRSRDGVSATFIVSQRTSSIRHADRIIVLEDGQMAGIGTHQELLTTCKVYREIYESQYGKGDEEKE